MDSTKQVLQREFPRLRRFAYSLTGNAADADDLVHDVIVKVLEKGLPNTANPLPWIFTLCKNVWIDELRYRNVRSPKCDAASISSSEEYMGTQKDSNAQQVQYQRVLKKLQSLPEGQRLALSLVAIEGLSYAEAAEVLEVPVGTIMSRVARARAFLVDYFEQGEALHEPE